MARWHRGTPVVGIGAAVGRRSRAPRRRLRQLGHGNTWRLVRRLTRLYGLGELRTRQAHAAASFSAMVLDLGSRHNYSLNDCRDDSRPDSDASPGPAQDVYWRKSSPGISIWPFRPDAALVAFLSRR